MAVFGYTSTSGPMFRPQALDVWIDKKRYEFHLYTFHLEERRIGPRRGVKEHRHDVFHLVLYTEGSNMFYFDGKSVQASPGLLILSSPGQSHDFSPLKKGSTVYHEMTFTLRNGDQMFKGTFPRLFEAYAGRALTQFTPLLNLSPTDLNWCSLYYQRIGECLKNESRRDWFQIYRIILDFFGFLMESLSPLSDTRVGKADPLSLVKEFIDRHYAGNHTLSELAGRINIGPEHFSRCFKKRFGVAPTAYRNSVRMKAARNLVEHSNLQCQEIAARVGFTDIHNFSKAFKKEMGMPPTFYRQNN